MMVIEDMGFTTLESINVFVEEMKKNAYKEEFVQAANIYSDYLTECFYADERLQQMVVENLSEDYISFVILPIRNTDDLNSFSFELASKNNDKIKRREEIKYKELCEICFGMVRPIYPRLLEFYENRNIYI